MIKTDLKIFKNFQDVSIKTKDGWIVRAKILNINPDFINLEYRGIKNNIIKKERIQIYNNFVYDCIPFHDNYYFTSYFGEDTIYKYEDLKKKYDLIMENTNE